MGEVVQVLAGLEMLAGQAVRLVAVDRHGHKHPLTGLVKQALWLGDVLEAVPAGDDIGLKAIHVIEAAKRAKPLHRFLVHIEAIGSCLKHEPSSADTDIDWRQLCMSAHELDARPGQRRAHLGGVKLLVFLEVRPAVVHRRARVEAATQLLRPEQAVGQPSRQGAGHSRRSSCRSCAAFRYSGRSCPAPGRWFGSGPCRGR
ncbi:hypothetical protein D3C78_406630 [compost metagenome]